MYQPKYTITNALLKDIGIIEACREVIENAPIIPAYEKHFRQEALIRTVHHGTHIEGNDLSLEQAERILINAKDETSAQRVVEKTGMAAKERDVQEVINYRNVMDYLGEQFTKYKVGGEQPFLYTEGQVKQIHKLACARLIPDEKQGVYRSTQVVLRDSRTGEVTFRPPPAIEVPYLMEDFILWINNKNALDTHPVLRAGVSHYAIASIHPFVDGNGRSARAFATLVLFIESYDIRRLFSLEEYFDRDAESYYNVLITTSNQSREVSERDLTSWLEYFTNGLAQELSRIKEKVRKLSVDSRIKRKRGQQVLLSQRQVRMVEFLSEHGKARMGQLRGLFPDFSDDTVLRELQILTRQGIIRKKGKTKGVHYELVT